MRNTIVILLMLTFIGCKPLDIDKAKLHGTYIATKNKKNKFRSNLHFSSEVYDTIQIKLNKDGTFSYKQFGLIDSHSPVVYLSSLSKGSWFLSEKKITLNSHKNTFKHKVLNQSESTGTNINFTFFDFFADYRYWYPDLKKDFKESINFFVCYEHNTCENLNTYSEFIDKFQVKDSLSQILSFKKEFKNFKPKEDRFRFKIKIKESLFDPYFQVNSLVFSSDYIDIKNLNSDSKLIKCFIEEKNFLYKTFRGEKIKILGFDSFRFEKRKFVKIEN